MSPQEAVRIQQELRGRVQRANVLSKVSLVAGVDVGFHGQQCVAAVAVLSYPDLALVEVARAERPVSFPYIPGLLSFRESPAVLTAMERLQHRPDLLLVDGHGLAHPRRFGIACHLGVLLDLPTIGCAKSRLCGTHAPLANEVGAQALLWDGGEVIGAVVRTQANQTPIYVSIGHQVDLPTAIAYTLECTAGHRQPEPTRQAHLAAR